MKILSTTIFVFLLGGCAAAYQPVYVGQQSSTPEQRVTFIGQDNNRTNGYTRTQVTLNPFPIAKGNIYARYNPYVISTYPIPEQVYVSCSNFETTHGLSKIVSSEYRRSYPQKYSFQPGKFYKFDCHKKDSELSGEYTVSMQVYDTMPKLKEKW